MMRVTLFGASGLLGQDLVQELKTEQLTAPSSKDADLRDRDRVRELIRDSRPDWILLSAAYTDVDGCESNPDLAFAVNCDGAVNVAEAAREAGSRLMFMSSEPWKSHVRLSTNVTLSRPISRIACSASRSAWVTGVWSAFIVTSNAP